MEIDFDNPPPTTVRSGATLTLKGLEEGPGTTRLQGELIGALSFIGSYIDLSTLDGVTVAVDYDAALAEVDRGMPGLRPLSRSNTSELQGVAMSPAVMRDGRQLTHLVFNAGPLAPLGYEDDPIEGGKRKAIEIIAHECAHVAVTAAKSAHALEAVLGTRVEGFEAAVTFQIAEIAWDEYAACRMSAPFGPDQAEMHAETLTAVLQHARVRSNEAIKSYRLHGDITRLFEEAGAHLCQPIKVASYFLGALDGDDEQIADWPEVNEAILKSGYGELVAELQTELRRMWNSQGSWPPGLEVYAPLQLLASRVFASGGIFMETDPSGRGRVDVPLTPETTPSDAPGQ